jgi:hypothetical protein
MIRIAAATLTVLAAMVGLVTWAQPDLPAQVATHWGLAGVPDGFTDRDRLWVVLAIPAALSLLLLPLAGLAGRLPSGMRWLAGLPVGLALGTATIVTGSLLVQRGLTDAADVAFPGWLVPLGIVLGILGLVGAARLVPVPEPVTTTEAAPAGATRADLPADRVVLWHATTPPAPALTWLGAAVIAVGIALSWAVSWWLLAVFVPVTVLLVATSQFDVTVGPVGVFAGGILLGWPRVSAPLGTITGADTTTTAFRDYGGWGLRMRTDLRALAVITRNGPALRLHRTDGVALVVSLDQPETAAAVVNALLDRRAVDAGA